MCSITSAPVLVTNQCKELAHILVAIDVSKQIEQEKAWRIVARRAVRGITIGNKSSDERKIDKRGNHLGHTALDITIEIDFNEAFFKLIIGKEPYIGERLLMGK